MTDREYILSFNRILKECDTVYHNAAAAAGLSDCAFWILYVLQDSERSYTQSEIGDDASMPRQTVNSALKKLEKDGYLALVKAEGKAGKAVILTEKGKLFSEKHIRPVIEAEIRVCASFSKEEKESFIDTFRSIAEKLGREIMR